MKQKLECSANESDKLGADSIIGFNGWKNSIKHVVRRLFNTQKYVIQLDALKLLKLMYNRAFGAVTGVGFD